MKRTIEQLLSAAQPRNEKGNAAFVTKTMQAVKAAASSAPFTATKHAHTMSKRGVLVTKLRTLKNRFRKLPPFISIGIIIGSTGIAAAAAYGTYQWIKPNVTVTNVQQSNDYGNRQYTVDSQCGSYLSGKSLQFEVARNSGLTDADARKVFADSCSYDAVSSFIDSHWVSNNDHDSFAKLKPGDLVTIYQHDNIFAGSTTNNPAFGLTLGNVTAISPTSISIQVPLYEVDSLTKDAQTNTQYYPQGKLFTRTIAVSPTVEVWQDGTMQSFANVHIGDQVQLVTRTQNYVKYYPSIHQNALGAQKTFDVAGIIKTNLNSGYIASAGTSLGNPQILNAISQLLPCYNNTQFLCATSINGGRGQTLFASPDAKSQYLRKDIVSSSVGPYQIDGKVQSITGNHVVLQTRGHAQTLTIDFPGNTLVEYNKNATLKLAVGDIVAASYSQKKNENHLVVKASDLEFAQLLATTLPDGTVVKY